MQFGTAKTARRVNYFATGFAHAVDLYGRGEFATPRGFYHFGAEGRDQFFKGLFAGQRAIIAADQEKARGGDVEATGRLDAHLAYIDANLDAIAA